MNFRQKNISILLLFLFTCVTFGSELKKIRSNASVKTQRIVFDLKGDSKYKIDKKGNAISLIIFDCQKASNFKNQKIKSKFIENFKITETNSNNLQINLSLSDNYKFKSFRLPDTKKQTLRIVLDISLKKYIRKAPDKIKKVVKKKSVNNKVQTTENKKYTIDDLKKTFEAKKYQQALEIANFLLKKTPKNNEAKYIKIDVLLNLADAQKDGKIAIKIRENSVAICEEILKDDKNNAKIITKVAEIYKLLGNNKKSEEYYVSLFDNSETKKDRVLAPILPKVKKKIEKFSLDLSPRLYYIFGGGLLFLILGLIFVIIKRKQNKKLYEDIEDVDLKEEIKVEKEIDEIKENKLEQKEESNESVSTNEEINDKTVDLPEKSEKISVVNDIKINESFHEDVELGDFDDEEETISVSLDNELKERIFELYEDGYTNDEIAEELQISIDEVGFVIRSIGEEDNESKKKNSNYLNEEIGGVTKSDDVSVMIKQIEDLLDSGLTIDDIAETLGKDKEEITFMLEISKEKKKLSESISDNVNESEIDNEIDDNEEDFGNESEIDNSSEEYRNKQIIKLASEGALVRDIAESLNLVYDEVLLIASVLNVEFTDEQKMLDIVESAEGIEEENDDLEEKIDEDIVDSEEDNNANESIHEDAIAEGTATFEEDVVPEDVILEEIEKHENVLQEKTEEQIEHIIEAESQKDNIDDDNIQDIIIEDDIKSDLKPESVDIKDDAFEMTKVDDDLSEIPNNSGNFMGIDINESFETAYLEKRDLDTYDLVENISALAKNGLSKNEIAKKLNIDKDEVEFVASMYGNIDFNDKNIDELQKDIKKKQPVLEIKSLYNDKKKDIDDIIISDKFADSLPLAESVDFEGNEDDFIDRFSDSFMDDSIGIIEDDDTENNTIIDDSNKMIEDLDTDKSQEDFNFSKKEFDIDDYNSYNEEKVLLSLEDEDEPVISEDEEMKIMKKVYELLDKGYTDDDIAKLVKISLDDVDMYKKIKDSDI